MTTSTNTTTAPTPNMNDRVHNILVLTETGLNALTAIGDAARGLVDQRTGGAIGDINALLHGIVAVVDSIQAGFNGEVTAEKVKADLAELTASIAQNNASIDREVDGRFPRQ